MPKLIIPHNEFTYTNFAIHKSHDKEKSWHFGQNYDPPFADFENNV